MNQNDWICLGKTEDLKLHPVSEVRVDGKKVALSYRDGVFGAVSGSCTHVGGPLGKGTLRGDYLVCPWHQWTFHRITGHAEPGYKDAVPQYELKEEGGMLWLRRNAVTAGSREAHEPHPLARPVNRAEGKIRVAGISTTAMDPKNPRYSTSDALLEISLGHAAGELDCDTRLIKLNDLSFRNCEGYYSKSASACTWPCSITQMDKKDQLDGVYEAIVHWADVILLSTPIRWGSASALYFKMAERLNCVQNQITINNRVLIQNKVASFIITGGQDNVQGVAGQLLTFFSELGFHFPQFPFIAHSRGWSAEDMERNMEYVQKNTELQKGAKELVRRSVETARTLLKFEEPPKAIARGGRKAHKMPVTETDAKVS